jgi:hypothetical protein
MRPKRPKRPKEGCREFEAHNFRRLRFCSNTLLGSVFFDHLFRHYCKSKSHLQCNTVQVLAGNGGTSCKNPRNCRHPPCHPHCNESLLSRLVRQFLLSRVPEPSGRSMHPIHHSLGECLNGRSHCTLCRLLHHDREASVFQKSTG